MDLNEDIFSEDLKHIVLCMSHRGRLNFLTGMLKFPPEKLFRKIRGLPEFPPEAKATGDVASHFVSSTELAVENKGLYVSMLYNPSHLDAVNPVSMGKTRGMMQQVKDGAYAETENRQWSDKVLNVQVKYIQNFDSSITFLIVHFVYLFHKIFYNNYIVSSSPSY